MHRRLFATAMAAVVSLSSAASAHAAPPSAPLALFGGQTASGKMVSFNVRNGSGETLVLRSGEQQFTVEPGKVLAMKLAEGAQITTVNATPKQAAGTVLTTVSRQLQGNTLVVS